MSTKDKILQAVRRRALTINELKDLIAVTRNAIVLPLKQLEADGLIEKRERRLSTAGKPPVEYIATAGTEDSESKAYKPFAEILVQTLPDYLNDQELSDLMKKVGRGLASHVSKVPNANLGDHVDAAVDFMNDVGAGLNIEETDSHYILQSFSCPLAGLTRQDACVCKAAESFFASATNQFVKEQCKRDERLVCEFLIRK